jgi:hypothetical protein
VPQVDVLFDESYAPGSGSVLDIAGLREAYGLTVAEADSIPAVRNAQARQAIPGVVHQ